MSTAHAHCTRCTSSITSTGFFVRFVYLFDTPPPWAGGWVGFAACWLCHRLLLHLCVCFFSSSVSLAWLTASCTQWRVTALLCLIYIFLANYQIVCFTRIHLADCLIICSSFSHLVDYLMVCLSFMCLADYLMMCFSFICLADYQMVCCVAYYPTMCLSFILLAYHWLCVSVSSAWLTTWLWTRCTCWRWTPCPHCWTTWRSSCRTPPRWPRFRATRRSQRRRRRRRRLQRRCDTRCWNRYWTGGKMKWKLNRWWDRNSTGDGMR